MYSILHCLGFISENCYKDDLTKPGQVIFCDNGDHTAVWSCVCLQSRYFPCYAAASDRKTQKQAGLPLAQVSPLCHHKAQHFKWGETQGQSQTSVRKRNVRKTTLQRFSDSYSWWHCLDVCSQKGNLTVKMNFHLCLAPPSNNGISSWAAIYLEMSASPNIAVNFANVFFVI